MIPLISTSEIVRHRHSHPVWSDDGRMTWSPAVETTLEAHIQPLSAATIALLPEAVRVLAPRLVITYGDIQPPSANTGLDRVEIDGVMHSVYSVDHMPEFLWQKEHYEVVVYRELDHEVHG